MVNASIPKGEIREKRKKIRPKQDHKLTEQTINLIASYPVPDGKM